MAAAEAVTITSVLTYFLNVLNLAAKGRERMANSSIWVQPRVFTYLKTHGNWFLKCRLTFCTKEPFNICSQSAGRQAKKGGHVVLNENGILVDKYPEGTDRHHLLFPLCLMPVNTCPLQSREQRHPWAHAQLWFECGACLLFKKDGVKVALMSSISFSI